MVEQKEKAKETTKFLGQEVAVTRLTREEVKRKLAAFEAKYGMTSQEFSVKWNRGELDCAIDDHWDWDFYYEAFANNSEIRTYDIRHLTGIRYSDTTTRDIITDLSISHITST